MLSDMKSDSFIPILDYLFKELNKSHIEYCLLRDYDSPDKINNANDLDISIASCDKIKAIAILDTLGWISIKLAVNDFAHSQYYKWDDTRFYKLDIIWDIFFADGSYRLAPQIIPYDERRSIYNAKLPKSEASIILLLAHMVFDKKTISLKNKDFLRFLHANDPKEAELDEVVMCALNSDSDNQTIINVIQKLLVGKR